jgi:membrane-bound inhibitor of C-type lysozyme
MPALRLSLAIAILPLAGCAAHVEGHGPAGIPYACADGRPARVFYEGGGWFPRARARLLFDGREIALTATPPTYGLRYVSDDDSQGPVLIWSARGEEAWLAELGADNADEREIAHCTRLRDGGAEEPVAAEEHH